MNQKGFSLPMALIVVVVVLIVGGVGFFVTNNYFGEPQKIKLNALKITNVYRDCTRSANENFRDITIQTTINVTAEKTGKYNQKISSDDITLRIGPNEIKGFSLTKAQSSDPNAQGIDESGLYMVTGGELRGDISDTITICYQDKCDVANIEICR